MLMEGDETYLGWLIIICVSAAFYLGVLGFTRIVVRVLEKAREDRELLQDELDEAQRLEMLAWAENEISDQQRSAGPEG